MDREIGPLMPEVGDIATVPDAWDAPWEPRHHVLSRLVHYFHVVWLPPAPEWRAMLNHSNAASYQAYDIESPPGLPVEILVNSDRGSILRWLAEAKLFWHTTGLAVDELKRPEHAEHFGIATVEAMRALPVFRWSSLPADNVKSSKTA